MDFSHYVIHLIQHIIKCEQDIMTMMNQMFLFLTIRQLWRSIQISQPLYVHTSSDFLRIIQSLYEESHGIIANHMYDLVYNETFNMGTKDGKW